MERSEHQSRQTASAAAAPKQGDANGGPSGLRVQLRRAPSFDAGAAMLAPVQKKGPSDDSAAEAFRIEEEISKLASRNAWAGVERMYLELQALGGPIKPGTHATAAQAARTRGDMGLYKERLELCGGDAPEVVGGLESLEVGYGKLEITSRKKDRPVELTLAIMPFAPDQRRAIEFAQATIKETGAFSGLLPVGVYEINGTKLDVQAGAALAWSSKSGIIGGGAPAEAEVEAEATPPSAAMKKLLDDFAYYMEHDSIQGMRETYEAMKATGEEIPAEYREAGERALAHADIPTHGE